VVLFAAALGLIAGATDVLRRQNQRLDLLSTEAQRSGIEIMSQTLNGNLMGAITLLGLTDNHIKQEAANGLLSIDSNIPMTLSILGNAFEAEGVFIAGQDGIVKTSWDRVNKPSTGLDVSFRPYYKMAMRGQSNMYAAISMASGDRALYFTAPVFSVHAKSTSGIGAVVARTNLTQVDKLLKEKFDAALLLSPQGVVFASNKTEWLGLIEGTPNALRLKAIRDLKQFGTLFEKAEPKVLPFTSAVSLQSINGQNFGVASAPVKWNDPTGEWKLVVLEDISRALPVLPSLLLGGGVGSVVLLLGWMLLHLVQGQHTQEQANQQLRTFARHQEVQAAYRTQLAALSVKLQRSQTLAELSQVFLLEARDLLGAIQGTLYVTNAKLPEQLILAGSSACAFEPPATLSLGETLLGQCAQERRIQVITTPPDGYWSVRSGLGGAQPAALLLTPLLLQDNLIGALELALLKVPDATAQEKCSETIALLTISVEILNNNLQLRQLSAALQTPCEGNL
jgi:hypothetical protein